MCTEAFGLEHTLKRDIQCRPVRISDNALFLKSDPDLFESVWYDLREFESEVGFQRRWLQHEHALRARGITDPKDIRATPPAKGSHRIVPLPADMRAKLESFHNFLRATPEYASVAVYIPDIVSEYEIPAWDGNRFDWRWVHGISDDDPRLGIEALGF